MSYETIRAWCQKFGAECSMQLKKCRGPIGDTWHLDEVYLKIDGRILYLWRAVDQEGEVIDILVQSHRDSEAAEKFFRKILGGEGPTPRRVITDRLGSYCVAMRKLMPGVEHINRPGKENVGETDSGWLDQRNDSFPVFQPSTITSQIVDIYSAHRIIGW